MENRNYGIDLLRIISMIMIIIIHLLDFGGIIKGTPDSSSNKYFLQILYIMCLCGVNIFAMISGYVGINAKHKISSFCKLYSIVFIYSLGLFFICSIHSFHKCTTDIWLFLFPITNKIYWYFTAYSILWFVMPFLNCGIKCIEVKTTSIYELIVFLLTMTLLPVFAPNGRCVYTLGLFDGYNIFWIGICYSLGAIIKKYRFFNKWSIYKLLLGLLCSCIFTPIWVVISSLFLNKYKMSIFSQYSSLPMALSALFFLLIFERFPKTIFDKLIKFVTPSIFPIYLIHVHPKIVDLYLDKFNYIGQLQIYYVCLCIIMLSFAIFSVCLLIDSIRRMFLYIISKTQ